MPHTILLVDDSKVIRELLKIYLMNDGFAFLEAEDGTRALSLARLMPVSLVIADVRMPGMDGLAFTRALRAEGRESLRRLPVILLTAHGGDAFRTEALAAGANAVLDKPVGCEPLRLRVREHLRGAAA
jgi:two-component system chemotaxis response regulator CheY